MKIKIQHLISAQTKEDAAYSTLAQSHKLCGIYVVHLIYTS